MISLTSLLPERYGGAAKERGIWYHGTSAKRAKKILVRGLDPDIPQKERSWDKDEPSAGSPTRESYGGIYVSRNLMSAYSAAGRTSRKDKANRAIVIMELQPRNLVSDEDDFGSRLSSIAGHLGGSVYHHIYPYMWETYGVSNSEHKEYAKDQKEKWCKNALVHIFYDSKPDERLKNRVYEVLFSTVYKAMLARVVSYLDRTGEHSYNDRYEWIRAYRDATGQYDKKEDEVKAPPPPSQQEGERMFMEAIDQLTRTMKHGLRQKFRGEFRAMNTARSLEPIGFSGKNRIVCIAEFPPSKASQYSEDIHVIYGTPPKQFVDDWEKAIGDARFV